MAQTTQKVVVVCEACRRSCGAKWRQGVGEKDYLPMLCDFFLQQGDFIHDDYDVLTSQLIASKMDYSNCPKLLHQLSAVGSSQDFLLIFLTVGHHFLVFFHSLTVGQSRHSFIYPLVTFIFLIATALDAFSESPQICLEADPQMLEGHFLQQWVVQMQHRVPVEVVCFPSST